MTSSFDILGLGSVAVDDLIYVASYPPVDAKTPVRRKERHCGGLVGTALVAAARLGAKCAYAGVLGDDELSSFVLNRLGAEGVDVTHIARDTMARPIHSVIVVGEDRGTRNIFFDLQGVIDPVQSFPDESLIRSARVLLLDHFGGEGKIRAARIAREANIPVVADFESDDAPRFPELLDLVDHLILSLEFGRKITSRTSPSDVAEKLWTDTRKTVALTCGSDGCWYLTDSDPRRAKHLPAYSVRTVDTTGCGDVFHGAYASALARSMEIEERLRFASASAALKATQPGGQKGIPSRQAVENFLESV